MLSTTDRGPNEVWAKKAIQSKLDCVPSCFFLPSDCLEHLAHLGVFGGLKLCDALLDSKGSSWKYFSAIAMITNTLRDLSQEVYATYRAMFGDLAANQAVKTLFPRAIAERWGSIDLTETRLIAAGISNLREVQNVYEQCW